MAAAPLAGGACVGADSRTPDAAVQAGRFVPDAGVPGADVMVAPPLRDAAPVGDLAAAPAWTIDAAAPAATSGADAGPAPTPELDAAPGPTSTSDAATPAPMRDPGAPVMDAATARPPLALMDAAVPHTPSMDAGPRGPTPMATTSDAGLAPTVPPPMPPPPRVADAAVAPTPPLPAPSVADAAAAPTPPLPPKLDAGATFPPDMAGAPSPADMAASPPPAMPDAAARAQDARTPPLRDAPEPPPVIIADAAVPDAAPADSSPDLEGTDAVDAPAPEPDVAFTPDSPALADAPVPDAPMARPDAASDAAAVVDVRAPDAATVSDAAPPPSPPPPTGAAAVLTLHNDNFRTGANLLERQLDVASVRARGMRVAFTTPVAGDMNAQPLYVSGLEVNGKTRDVVFIATMNNNVYAFDANEAAAQSPGAQALLWQVHFDDPEDPGARPFARGIFSTPVIDPQSGTMYVVFGTRNFTRDYGMYTPEQTAMLNVESYLVALDIHDGRQRMLRKLAGTYPRNDGSPVAFEARNHWCRPGLLLSRGSIYVACGMRNHESYTLFHGWVFRYDASSFTPQGTFCTTPDVNEFGQGGAIWQAGGGLAEDREGNVYFITANGPWDPGQRLYSDALVKLSPAGSSLLFGGAFSPETPERTLQENDVDFGAGGPLVLPDAPFVFGAGKTGIGYLLELGTMAKAQEFQAGVNQYDPTRPVDSDWESGPHMHGTSTYWRAPDGRGAYVYWWAEKDYLRRMTFDLRTRRFDPSTAVQGNVLALDMTMPGGMTSLSANGSTPGTGILWATLPRFQDPDHNPGGRLLAYDAETLELLWETTFPSLPKWMPPTIADGKVFVGTTSDQFITYVLGP